MRDADGKWVGHVDGVWGGYLWRNGERIDPYGDMDGNMRSVYQLVWYDRHRGTWRAEVVKDGHRHYLSQTADEDEAGEAAWRWLQRLPDSDDDGSYDTG